MNPLQFSWANTLIDPSSVDLRFRTHADKLDVLDTTFPTDKPQMLYWNVKSELDGDAVVEITYFTSGISWAADYVCTADVDETELAFDGFVRIFNTPARTTKTPRCGSWWARSISWSASRISPGAGSSIAMSLRTTRPVAEAGLDSPPRRRKRR